MPLLPAKELLTRADEGGYAVGAFNVINMESAQAVIQAAEEENSPVIVQVTQTTLPYTEPEELSALIRAIIEKTRIPVAMHLDHGRTFEIVVRFLRLGFTSVMIDGSLQPDAKTPRTYEENVEVTKLSCRTAHAVGVSVEGEFGRLGQIGTEIKEEDMGTTLTDPDMAAKFVEETGVDSLAVAIGTTHGLFRGTPTIVHDRLREIDSKVRVPLVMHGGTGVPDDAVRKAVELGIRKVNIDTHVRMAFYEKMTEMIHQAEKEHAEADAEDRVRKYDIRKLMKPCREAMKEAVKDRIRVFGGSGKASAFTGV